jgi:hypothetical protein
MKQAKNLIWTTFILAAVFGAGFVVPRFLQFGEWLSQMLPESKLYSASSVPETVLPTQAISITFPMGTPVSNAVENFDPYSSLFKVANSVEILCFAALVISLIYVVVTRAQRNLPIKKNQSIFLDAVVSAMLCTPLFGRLILGGVRGNQWDETFLFVSQIESILAGRGNVVQITGAKHFAEASADVGFLWLSAGVRLITGLSPLVSMLIVNSIGFGLLFGIIFYIVVSAGCSRLFGLTVGLAVTLVNSSLLSSASAGFPVVWTTVLMLALFQALTQEDSEKRLNRCGWISIFLILFRPDMFLIAVISILLCLFLRLREFRNSSKESDGTSAFSFVALKSVIVFLGVLLLTTLYRMMRFSVPLPSGVIGKSNGLTSDYLIAGFQHLIAVNSLVGLGYLLAACVVCLTILKKPPFLILIPAVVALIPGLISGGDWFPAVWARYSMPTLLPLTIVCISQLGKRKIRSFRFGEGFHSVSPRWLMLAVLIPFFALELQTASSRLPFNDLLRDHRSFRNPSGDDQALRPVCLARGGLLIRAVLPSGVGIATPEINTLAYFANQPLTDLMGIVDQRTAVQPFEPHSLAAWGAKRRNPKLIDTDNSGAIYQHEAVGCQLAKNTYGDGRFALSAELRSGGSSIYASEVFNWMTPTGFEFRFGNPTKISEEFIPVSIQTEGSSSVGILLRKSLLPEVLRNAKIGRADVLRVPLKYQTQ